MVIWTNCSQERYFPLQDGKVIHCHLDQIRLRYTEDSESPLPNEDDVNMLSRAREPQVSSEVLTDIKTERHYPSRVHGPPKSIFRRVWYLRKEEIW